jgi:hypothetical protein
MNHLSKCLYGILAIVCFASCNKNSDPAPTDDPVQQDTLLSKAILWDSSKLGATAYTQEFVFDDQKRVIMRINYDSDTNGVRLPAAKTDTFLQFFYNGTERNAYRTIGSSFFSLGYKADVLHFYNSNNQIIKDSIYSSAKSYSSRTYTYLSDKLITYDVYITSILPPGYYRDTFQVINNNIASGKFKFYQPANFWDAFTLTYDNKINPLTKLNIASHLLLEGGQAFTKNPYLSPGYCKNNITKRITTWSSTNSLYSTDTFEYTYNGSNLPVYCKIFQTVYPTSSGRVKYLYTH